MSTLQDRMSEALQHRQSTASNPNNVNQAELARACGVQPPSVSDWFSGKTKSLRADTALRAAAYLRVRPEWLSDGRGPMIERKTPPAQPLSDHGHKLLPPLYSWEGMMAVELPEEFRLVVGEASLAPLVPEGTTAFFVRSKKARPGEGILVEDGEGVRHFRRYRPLSGGQWEAYAMQDGYRLLESVKDPALKILAAYDGQRGSLAT